MGLSIQKCALTLTVGKSLGTIQWEGTVSPTDGAGTTGYVHAENGWVSSSHRLQKLLHNGSQT